MDWSSSSSGAGKDGQDSQQGAPGSVSRPALIKPTKEEEAVLRECRRNATTRGLALGVSASVILRWLVTRGRVPHHVQRWSRFYYIGAFIGSYEIGVISYRLTCMKKILALENSPLADKIREHMKQSHKESLAKLGIYKEGDSNKEASRSPPQHHHHHHSSPNQRQQEQRTYPTPGQYHQSPLHSPTSESDEPSFSIDKAAKEEPVEQPDVFESFSYSPKSTHQSHSVDSWEDKHKTLLGRPRGRTFDDIREENRQQQLQQQGTRLDSDRNQEQQQGGIKRRNKYGDEIYEEKSR